MTKHSIVYGFAIFRDGEFFGEYETSVDIVDCDIKLVGDFIKECKEHQSGEFIDIPAKVYDKCMTQAKYDASEIIPKDDDANFEVALEELIPLSLIDLLPDDVLDLLPDKVFAENYGPEELEQIEDEEKNDDDDEAPTKENTLYLVIKQVYFDQIVEGVKKEEFREIKDTTYKKYLQFFDDGTFNYNPNVIDENDPLLGDILIWNNGDYPYLPINYKYLSLAVGYNKERDTALVKVEDISFTPMLDKKGNPARLHDDCNGGINLDSNGELCFWQVVYHLGQVIEINRAK